MPWNYRVIRKDTEEPEEPYYYQIYEVYYDDQGNIEAWSENPIRAGGETTEELGGDLGYMVMALSKPVLIYEELEAAAEQRRQEHERLFQEKFGHMSQAEMVQAIRDLVPELCPYTEKEEQCVYHADHSVPHRCDPPEKMLRNQLTMDYYPLTHLQEIWDETTFSNEE